jgi:hypothetical protein
VTKHLSDHKTAFEIKELRERDEVLAALDELQRKDGEKLNANLKDPFWQQVHRDYQRLNAEISLPRSFTFENAAHQINTWFRHIEKHKASPADLIGFIDHLERGAKSVPVKFRSRLRESAIKPFHFCLFNAVKLIRYRGVVEADKDWQSCLAVLEGKLQAVMSSEQMDELRGVSPTAQSAEPLLAVQESAPSTRKRRGPPPDPERDAIIAAVLNSVPNWKYDIHQLETVLRELDRLTVEMPGAWEEWDPPPASWLEAAERFRLVRQVFDRVLARVAERAARAAIVRN